MILDPELSIDDLTILQEAVERALDLGEQWNVVFEAGQLAALLCAAYLDGERDPGALAVVAVKPLRVLH
jgi:hypothetical protein